MKIVEFKRRDGKPLYANADQVVALTAGTENPEFETDAWIGSKMFILGDPLQQARKKWIEATL